MTSFVLTDSFSRISLTSDQANMSGSALSMPTEGITWSLVSGKIPIFLCLYIDRTNNCTIGFGCFVILFDYPFDPWCFSGSSDISYVTRCKGVCIFLRINIVSSIVSASFDNWGRVQMVRANAVDDQARLPSQGIQFLLVELDNQDFCILSVFAL